MIRRGLAALAVLWIIGFAWFAIFLPRAAGNERTDAAVVLTGGPDRIDRALAVIERNEARRLLISGVDRDVKPAELAATYKRPIRLFDCCVDLGFQSVDTRSNALETARWARRAKVRSLRLITSDWHMRRARLELDKALPGDVTVVEDAVATRPTLATLFKEYNKYWLRALAALVGV